MSDSAIPLTKQLVARIALLSLLLYTSLFFLQQTNLATSDLGRHLMNGRIANTALWHQDWATFHQLLTTNFYSYTEPQFPTFMHHWLFGVLAVVVESVAGFAGLTVINTLVVVSGFGLLLWTVGKKTSLQYASLAGLLVLPLLASRTEVRPESFSVLGIGVTYWAVSAFAQANYTRKRLLVAAFLFFLIQALWVNLHIFFPLGVAIVGLFWLAAIWHRRGNKHILSAALIGSVSGSLCTPLGITGVLAPFTVFGNYGYMIVENMPLWFMLQRFGSPLYWYMAGCAGLLMVFSVGLLRKNVRTQSVHIVLAVIGLAGMVVLNRFANVTAVLVLPLLANILQHLKLEQRIPSLLKSSTGLALSSLLGTAVLVAALASGLFVPQIVTAGLGLTENSLAAAAFIQQNNLPEPIFNNYDIGSYLIYTLPSPTKVFVDNRPESYSADFLQQTLVAAQENEIRWKEVLTAYQFNSIVFYRHDMTPWAQPFLIRRLEDPNWVPIYVDEYVLILVAHTPQNTKLIEKFAIPQEVFRISR